MFQKLRPIGGKGEASVSFIIHLNLIDLIFVENPDSGLMDCPCELEKNVGGGGLWVLQLLLRIVN
jgi:hypothetical protein